jgi:hypothetical protein
MDGTEVVDGPSLRQSLQTTRLFPLTPFSWRQRQDEIEFVTFPHSKHAMSSASLCLS